MTNPIIRTHNSETNEVVDIEMTDQEYSKHQNDIQIALEAIAREE
jgi:hypothetical protein